MSEQIARLGDLSSHGGFILSPCSPTTSFDGKPVARTTDLHACPIMGHGVTPLTGTASFTVDGLRAVRVTDTAGCGAAIVPPCSVPTADQ